jgi:hypothetical protein
MSYAPVCNIWLNEAEHLLGRLSDANKDTVVDLEEAEELQDLAGFRCNLIDTVYSLVFTPDLKDISNTYPRIRTTKYTFAWAGT